MIGSSKCSCDRKNPMRHMRVTYKAPPVQHQFIIDVQQVIFTSLVIVFTDLVFLFMLLIYQQTFPAISADHNEN